MEPKFQTSFIPKKQLSVATSGGSSRHSVSILMTIALLVFIISIAGAGFAFAWERVLNSQQEAYKSDLAKDQNQFNTDLITTLTTADTKISIAKTLLADHLAVSQIFSIISQLTISSVRWKSLQFAAPGSAGGASAAGPGISISMQGEADSFYSVAYQSDVFGQSAEFGTNKVIKNPVLSNLSVDPTTGHVDFAFTATMDPAELSYVAQLAGSTASSSASNQ
jgi:hypothetical protein